MTAVAGDFYEFIPVDVTEPQNASEDSFGDRKLEQVVRDNQSRPPSELSEQLLSEICVWQSASVTNRAKDSSNDASLSGISL